MYKKQEKLNKRASTKKKKKKVQIQKKKVSKSVEKSATKGENQWPEGRTQYKRRFQLKQIGK